MRTIKKLLIAICALWAGSSQAVTADDQLNYIYAEKGRLNIHIGTVPDQFQSIRLPIWSDQKGQDDLIWYPVQRGEHGFRPSGSLDQSPRPSRSLSCSCLWNKARMENWWDFSH